MRSLGAFRRSSEVRVATKAAICACTRGPGVGAKNAAVGATSSSTPLLPELVGGTSDEHVKLETGCMQPARSPARVRRTSSIATRATCSMRCARTARASAPPRACAEWPGGRALRWCFRTTSIPAVARWQCTGARRYSPLCTAIATREMLACARGWLSAVPAAGPLRVVYRDHSGEEPWGASSFQVEGVIDIRTT